MVASTLAFDDPPLITGARVLDRCRAAGAAVVDALAAVGALDVTDDRTVDVPLPDVDGNAVFAGESS